MLRSHAEVCALGMNLRQTHKTTNCPSSKLGLTAEASIEESWACGLRAPYSAHCK